MPPTSYSSLWKRGTPRIFSTSAAVTSGLNCSSKPMFFARVRTIFAMFLSSAHARFAGILADHLLDHLRPHPELLGRDAVRLELLRDQVLAGNLYLILRI